MIKKIILILTIIVFCVVPVIPIASADDIGSPDNNQISFSCTAKSKEVKIGEPFEFTLKITNNTPKKAELANFMQVFDQFYNTTNVNLDDTVVEPYKTKILDISYLVPTYINWYEIDGVYYTDFHPGLIYWFKEENEERYNNTFFQLSKNQTPFKITNLSDGSEFASLKIIDDKFIIGFNDGAYKHAYWKGELVSRITNYLEIKNNCDKPMADICPYDTYYDQLYDETLDPGQSFTYVQDSGFYYLENEIPETLDVEYKLMYQINGRYYCLCARREYQTGIYKIPDIHVIETVEYSENDKMNVFKYSIKNNTNIDYKNFVVFYGEYMAESLNEWENNCIFGELKAGDLWMIPKNYFGKFLKLQAGFFVDNVFYYAQFNIQDCNTIKEEGNTKVYDFKSEHYYEGISDMYDLYHETNFGFSTPTPTIEPTPTTNPTTVITPTPTVISTSTPLAVTESGSFYIPPYIYIAFALSVLATCVVIVISRRKKKDN